MSAYLGYNATTGAFTPEPRDASVLSRSTTGAIVYRRSLSDGSVEVYAHSNNATGYPRLVFLTQVIDPARKLGDLDLRFARPIYVISI